MNRLVLLIVGVVWMAAVADDDALLAKVKPPAKDAPRLTEKYPSRYDGFEKRIKDLEGKAVHSLIPDDTITAIQLQNYDDGRDKKRKHLTGADFIRALRTGKIVPDAKMSYDLQFSEQCVVQTTKGDFRIGVYYEPVAYVVLPNDECYWFFFGEKDN